VFVWCTDFFKHYNNASEYSYPAMNYVFSLAQRKSVKPVLRTPTVKLAVRGRERNQHAAKFLPPELISQVFSISIEAEPGRLDGIRCEDEHGLKPSSTGHHLAFRYLVKFSLLDSKRYDTELSLLKNIARSSSEMDSGASATEGNNDLPQDDLVEVRFGFECADYSSVIELNYPIYHSSISEPTIDGGVPWRGEVLVSLLPSVFGASNLRSRGVKYGLEVVTADVPNKSADRVTDTTFGIIEYADLWTGVIDGLVRPIDNMLEGKQKVDPEYLVKLGLLRKSPLRPLSKHLSYMGWMKDIVEALELIRGRKRTPSFLHKDSDPHQIFATELAEAEELFERAKNASTISTTNGFLTKACTVGCFAFFMRDAFALLRAQFITLDLQALVFHVSSSVLDELIGELIARGAAASATLGPVVPVGVVIVGTGVQYGVKEWGDWGKDATKKAHITWDALRNKNSERLKRLGGGACNSDGSQEFEIQVRNLLPSLYAGDDYFGKSLFLNESNNIVIHHQLRGRIVPVDKSAAGKSFSPESHRTVFVRPT
jgi:hypothetical protein